MICNGWTRRERDNKEEIKKEKEECKTGVLKEQSETINVFAWTVKVLERRGT